MEVIWKKPSEYPQVEQGQDIKVWGVVDFHFYRCEYGGLGDDGKAIRTATLEKVSRQVVELRFANTEAKKEWLEYHKEHGEFPADAPGWLDEWCNEDGDFLGLHGFYNTYCEEGHTYFEEYTEAKGGNPQILSHWTGDKPERILLAWAEFETPDVPEQLPE